MTRPDHHPVEKSVWTDADFDQMGWHDNRIHAIAIEPDPPWPGRVLIDLDYIVKWVQPTESSFNFWISPATLVFDHASDLVVETIDLTRWGFDLEMIEIRRDGPDEHGTFLWSVVGDVSFRLRSRGFTQYLRRPPVLIDSQRLSSDQRGGISFEEHGYQL